ncbi:MAG: alpha/beta hydrolase [Euzebya sp.]
MNVLTTSTDDLTLEGRFQRPQTSVLGGALILHPHPAFGGHMDVWLLPSIAQALAEQGWASLRINFRGVEGSQGVQSGGRDENRDAEGALEWLRREVPDVPLAVVGWSFGAMIGLRLGLLVDCWVGIGPPTRRIPQVPLEGTLIPDELPPRRTVIVGEHDQFFPPSTVDVIEAHQVVVVPGADHFMFDRDPEVARKVCEAVERPLYEGAA